jgi:radical SAM superfamily enzyme YgiQ (UPF0313 family)
MDKKNVYLVQPNSRTGNTISFPYAAGVIAAYAWQFPQVRDNYHIGKLFYKKDPVNDVLPEIENPFLVGFSNYMWNCEYNLSLAQQVKQCYPECVIVFGGHQIPNDTGYLERYDFIDILIHGEGEEIFTQVLTALAAGGGLELIPNISYRNTAAGIVKTTQKEVVLQGSPSPYLEGIFDPILQEKDNDIKLDAVIETNRGCPNRCTYCCWVAPKVRLMPEDKILREIEWISSHKIEYCFCADANFGMFDRDEMFVDAVIDAKRKTGYPLKFEVACFEGRNDFVFEINKKLNEAGLSKGATLPFQSLSSEVLANVGRRGSFDKSGVVALLDRYHKAGIPVYSDIILGLPGETYESFSKGLCDALELGQHNSINVHHCEVLPNAKMANPRYIEKFGIKTVSSPLCQPHCENTDDSAMAGSSRIIVETAAMSRDDWKKANSFTVCVVGFHNYGLLQCFAIYLHNEMNVSYYDFYSSLITWIKTKSVFCKSAMDKATGSLTAFLEGEGKLLYQEDKFGKIFWALEEGLFLNIAYGLDVFYAEIEDFLRGYQVDKHLYNELLNYQKSIIVVPNKTEVTLQLDFDFYDYFTKALVNIKGPLTRRKNTMTLQDEGIPADWCEYGIQYVWYGKRESKTLFTSKPKSVSIVYEGE